jgi:hypothetical protein
MSRELILQAASVVALPSLIGRAGKLAAKRFLEFFTVNSRNAKTRAAFALDLLMRLSSTSSMT